MTPRNALGAQMFTLREFCATPADIAKSCQRVAEMGYGGIQASAAGFNDIEAPELRKILDDCGLACMATHRGLDSLKDTAAAVDYHKALDCRYVAIGGFGFGGDKTPADWEAFCREFNEIADALAEHDLHLGYHNHSHELAPLTDQPPRQGDPRPYDIMIERFGGHVWFEVDTYWLAHGGADPADWLRHLGKTAGGVPCVHFKDLSIDGKREHRMVEVGSGNLNWPAILEACREIGVKYYLVERDRGEMDPFESLEVSFKQMQAMGLA